MFHLIRFIGSFNIFEIRVGLQLKQPAQTRDFAVVLLFLIEAAGGRIDEGHHSGDPIRDSIRNITVNMINEPLLQAKYSEKKNLINQKNKIPQEKLE